MKATWKPITLNVHIYVTRNGKAILLAVSMLVPHIPTSLYDSTNQGVSNDTCNNKDRRHCCNGNVS